MGLPKNPAGAKTGSRAAHGVGPTAEGGVADGNCNRTASFKRRAPPLLASPAVDAMFSSLLPLLPALAATAAAETIHGAALFSRHGDRTPKVVGPTALTIDGQNQMFQSGSYWHSRYVSIESSKQILQISPFAYDASEIYSAAPDSPVLVMSGQAFMQGLYPPSPAENMTLTNGTTMNAPLDGFQYVPIHSITPNSPDTIWLQGQEGCDSYDAAGEEFYLSPEYAALEASTGDFYMGFYDKLLAGVFPKENVTYKNAYMIFDYLNVGVVHNKTIAEAVTSDDLFQLRTLADSHEWALNGNASAQILLTAGQTVSSQLLTYLEKIVSTKGVKNKLNVFFGSYDTFQSLFSLLNLPSASPNFFGLPDYAAVVAIELLTANSTVFPSDPDNDLLVRFLFRNGTTQGDAAVYPLFGHESPQFDTMPWGQFRTSMQTAIGKLNSTEQWCGICGSSAPFCSMLTSIGPAVIISPENAASKKDKLSPAAAGGVGAVCALAVVAIGALLAALLGVRLRRKTSSPTFVPATTEKSALAKETGGVEKVHSTTSNSSIV